MPIRLYAGQMDNYSLGLGEDEDYIMVEDPENLFLFHDEEKGRGFYFTNNRVIELTGYFGYWECVGYFPEYLWASYQEFIKNIGV